MNKAIEKILTCNNGVAFTGSGISAESGISTYRDAGGIWDRYKEGSSGGMLAVLSNHPEEAPEILGGFFEKLLKAKPNPGHLALSDIEGMGYIQSIITQNVDNLHREAGSSVVYELHGNIFRQRCMQCGKKNFQKRDELSKSMGDIIQKLKEHGLQEMGKFFPRCDCGGNMRPDIVSFGEEVQDLIEATKASTSCDFMLIVGTSGVVYPAASLPMRAKNNGAFVIEVNPKESELTSLCDIFIKGSAGEMLPKLVSAIKENRVTN